jgi:predicted nucleic acid-binding protein
MAVLVLDASVVLAVALQETNRHRAASLLGRVAEDGAVVPNIWHVEVGNALLTAERRMTISPEERDEAMQNLSRLPVTVDPETAPRAWRDTLSLAQRHRLTLYDATHLELGLRHGLPLATFDAALRRAANAANVPLL